MVTPISMGSYGRKPQGANVFIPTQQIAVELGLAAAQLEPRGIVFAGWCEVAQMGLSDVGCQNWQHRSEQLKLRLTGLEPGVRIQPKSWNLALTPSPGWSAHGSACPPPSPCLILPCSLPSPTPAPAALSWPYMHATRPGWQCVEAKAYPFIGISPLIANALYGVFSTILVVALVK